MIFKDKNLQSQFNLNGYIVIPFLTVAQVEELRSFFFTTHPALPDGFYSSSFNSDAQHKQRVNEKIDLVLNDAVNNCFGNIQKLGGCFLNKQPGIASEMPIHQDWTVVNEPEFDSITVWIPLQDVNETNGAIQVIDGSHRFSTALRSPTLEDPFKNVQNELRKDLKLVPMKAGEAFIFSQALLHASPPNLSNQPRVAVTYGLINSEAQLMFYHRNPEGQTEHYLVNENFFQEYNTQIGQRPVNAELKNVFSYEQHFVSAEEYKGMKQKFLQQKAASMYKMIPIFKDEERQRFFEQEGYAVFPLLNETEVAELNSYYESLQLKDEKGFGFHVSMDNGDKEMCRRTREKIWGVALPRLAEHLKDFKPFVASYVVKETNPKGVVPAHQDWSFVDREEDGYSSITCWIALVDTHIDNGGMGVIRGSHKFMQNHRPSPSPQCPVPLSEHMFSIFPYLHTVDVKAGEVLMFDNRTFHASPPNTSGTVRLAAGVGVTQQGAQLVHYYMKPDGTFKTMLRYNVDEEFYLKYENATLSKMYDEQKLVEGYGEPVEVPYAFTQYTTEEMVEVVTQAGNVYNVPMTEKLAKLFGYSENTQKSTPEPVEEITEPEPQPTAQQTVWQDDRTFFEKYTPLNIAREIKNRLVGA